METKFNNAVEDLIETGDIKHKGYIAFCVTHDVEPKIKPKPKYTPSSDPCGHGGAPQGHC